MEHEEKFILNRKEAEAVYHILGNMNITDQQKLVVDLGYEAEYKEIFDFLYSKFE